MVYREIKNIFLFAIICANFNIICMENNANCVKLEDVQLNDESQVCKGLDFKSIFQKMDPVDIEISIADIKQNLLELFGEIYNKENTQKEAVEKVVKFLKKSDYESDDIFKKLTGNLDPVDPLFEKCKKTPEEVAVIIAVLKGYKNRIVENLKQAYGICVN
jgi:hypothetical protein